MLNPRTNNMDYTQVQTRQTKIICSTELGIYADHQENKSYLTMVEHRFSLKDLKDKIFCLHPAKSFTLDEFFMKVTFKKCHSCTLCKQTEKKMR